MPWATGGGPSLQVGPGTKLHPYTPSPSNYRAVGCSRDMFPFWTTVSPLTKQKRPDWTVQFDEQFSKSKHTHVQRHGKTMAPCSRDSHTGLHTPSCAQTFRGPLALQHCPSERTGKAPGGRSRWEGSPRFGKWTLVEAGGWPSPVRLLEGSTEEKQNAEPPGHTAF